MLLEDIFAEEMQMRDQLLLFALACSLSIPALAQPTIGTEGKWEGMCVRGGKSASTNVIIDQNGARMNDVGANGFSKNGLTVKFTVPGRYQKRFEGQFSSDTSMLTGSLTVEGRVASCNLSRKINAPDRICIRNPDPPEIWWKLDPGNPSSPVRLLGGQEDRGTGALGGKLCWGKTETEANSCRRSLPQSSYGC